MRLKPMRVPPTLATGLSWRELYERGAFAQRELISTHDIRSEAKDRRVSLGIASDETLEWLDQEGAFRPVAFALAGYSAGWLVPAAPATDLVFREEEDAAPWSSYAEEELTEDGVAIRPSIDARYSPWQLLYAADVVDGSIVELPTALILESAEEREAQIKPAQSFVQAQRDHWREIDAAWQPLLKVLVRLQNYYWPRITELVSIVHGKDADEWVEAGQEAAPDFTLDPAAVLSELGASVDELLAAYYFLVERGIEIEPRDGLILLRRARPRPWHIRWQGEPRRAQDNFDAAEHLRRFLQDLTGENPPHPASYPLDGLQPERAVLYERGPGAPFEVEQLKSDLHALELYPPGVLVVGEGPSERIMVETLAGYWLRGSDRERLGFTDLGGSGAAARVEELVQRFGEYTTRTVVIVDREGQMAEYLKSAEQRGSIADDDLLLFDDSLEASNASTEELIELARKLAAEPKDEREPVELRLTVETLETYHSDRRAKVAPDRPGIADSLIILARRDDHGQVELSKPELAEELGELILSEWDAAATDEERADILQRRPILNFVIERVIGAFNQRRPVGRRI